MELYKEILAYALTQGEVQIVFHGQETDIAKIVEGICYQTLLKIKGVLEDQQLDDKECFQQIEEIVCIFEEIGSTGDGRHDFG